MATATATAAATAAAIAAEKLNIAIQLDARTLLRRFCYLGSLDSVYIYKTSDVEVIEYLPRVHELCKALDAEMLVSMFAEMLQLGETIKLVRRDEPLFAYATCLSSGVVGVAEAANSADIKWKTTLRQAFPGLIHSDTDLFLFCKYAMLISKAQNHQGFSQTVRKAITSWYDLQHPEAIRDMWLTKRGAHGFKHCQVIKLCHISDTTIGAAGMVSHYFKTCSDLLKEDSLNPSSTSAAVPPANLQNRPTQEGDSGGAGGDKVAVEKKSSVSSSVVLMSKLRTTNDKTEALKIIRKLKLRYNQVPSHLLKDALIMEELIPTMTHLQLLKCWRAMAKKDQLKNPRILKLVQAVLENRRQLHHDNVHPIVFLMQMHELGIRGDLSRLAPKKVDVMKMAYIKQIYTRSFGQNLGTGLRFHITINLQTNYKKKMLQNHKKLSFYDASVALAFGYFKKEGQVDVFHWDDKNKTKLIQLPWTRNMEIKDAIACCDAITNTKNQQRLVNPVLNSLPLKQVYDVFLAIVPTAGRGNPNKCSELLCKFLDRYRLNKNLKAKYVVVNLLKFRKSMSYSSTRNENILEICGLDEHTTNLINNFALNRFG